MKNYRQPWLLREGEPMFPIDESPWLIIQPQMVSSTYIYVQVAVNELSGLCVRLCVSVSITIIIIKEVTTREGRGEARGVVEGVQGEMQMI